MTNSNNRVLSLVRPDLVCEWDFEKNSSTSSPDVILAGSNKKVWWKCSFGHSWQATVNNRTNGAGCPYCSGRARVRGTNDLASTNPDLLAEWDYEKNNSICSPDNVSAGSHTKVYWKCKEGHSWQAEIRRRAKKGSRCPYCSNKRRLSGFNDLATKFPQLLSEWDYERNEKDPSELTPSSHEKAWWICADCGGKWQAEVANRTAGTGCPECGRIKAAAGQKIATYQKSVAFLHPEVLEEWDYDKNNHLDPNTVYPSSTQKAWWICPKCKQHYQASVGNRIVNGSACPVCAGKVVASGINDLETWCRENDQQIILEEWDNERNIIFPNEISPFANKKVWFVCKEGHSYQSILANRTSNHTGCPICNRRKGTSFQEQACFYYLERCFPSAINSYHERWLGKLELDIYLPELKIAVEYDGVAWHKDEEKDLVKNKLCEENGVKLIRLREHGLPILHNCAFIDVKNRSSQALNRAIQSLLVMLGKKDDDIDIDVDRDTPKIIERYDFQRKENSISSVYPELLKEWDYEKNGIVKPEYVSYGSERKYWWKCSECGNSFLMSANNRTNQNQGCPKCSGFKKEKTRSKQLLAKKGSLAAIMPEILNEWDFEKNALPPDKLTIGSKQKAWWKCQKCGGSWQAEIQNRTKKKGTGCPYCSGRKALGGFNDLATQYPSLLNEWVVEKNNGLQPADFTAGSHQKILWTCRVCGNEWIATIGKRTSGEGCPKCARKVIAKKQSKRVICIESNRIFDSVKEAADWAGIKDSTLVGCLNGKQKSAGGYHWTYADQKER